MSGDSSSTRSRHEVKAGVAARGRQILFMFLVMALELFLGAGRLNWTWAWIFLGINLLSVAVNAVFMLWRSPETVAERGRPREVKGWDRWIGGGWLIGQYFLLPLIAGLDERFSWSADISPGLHFLGALILAFGLGLTGWAMVSNAFFSTAVRLQSDRGQQVCRTGPYQYVRHPGYVGFFLQALGSPILLGSLWALLFAIPAGVLMVVRTRLEDRLLQAELPGYKEYSHEVRFRLIPGIW